MKKDQSIWDWLGGEEKQRDKDMKKNLNRWEQEEKKQPSRWEHVREALVTEEEYDLDSCTQQEVEEYKEWKKNHPDEYRQKLIEDWWIIAKVLFAVMVLASFAHYLDSL